LDQAKVLKPRGAQAFRGTVPERCAMRRRPDTFSIGVMLAALLFGLGFLIDFLTRLA
jgi:hypothetical protein